MRYFLKFCRENFSYILLSAFFLCVLFNPVFKKYDYGAEFPMLLVFGVILVLVAIAEFKKEREVSKSAIFEKIFLLIFMAAVVLSFVFSQTKNYGFSEVLAFCSLVPLYLIFAHKKINWTSKFLQIAAIGTILSVCLGYFIYFFLPGPRMFGVFFNILYHSNVWPNAFALFLVLTWPIFLLFSKNKKAWLTALVIGFVLSGLLLTFSRGALIVFGGQLVLLLIYFIKCIKLKTVFWALMTGVFAVALFFGANFIRSSNNEKVVNFEQKIEFSNSESLTSKQERVDFWLGAIKLIEQKPIFGWGPYSFRYAYNAIQKTFLGNSDHPHNVFLKIGMENGVIALGAFLAFLISVFVVMIKRFKNLDRNKKDAVYILGACVAGGFAHNLIDYNLNFFANLLLLFLFIIFIRSLVAKNIKIKKAITGLVLAIIIALFSLYEGAVLIMSHIEYSLFPRDYYLNKAQSTAWVERLDVARIALNKQISLNPLSAEAWHLLGLIEKNKDYLKKALELEPMNEFSYYRDYFKVLTSNEKKEIVPEIEALLTTYFTYVQDNVHFTAYTSNVEDAADLIDLIIPYLPKQLVADFSSKKTEMLQAAENLRAKKSY